MKLKDMSKKVTAGVGVALATTGLTTCTCGCACDPPAPAFCTGGVATQKLGSTASLVSASTLEVRIKGASWLSATVSGLTGVTLKTQQLPDAGTPGVAAAGDLVLTFDLVAASADAGVDGGSAETGSFTVDGRIKEYGTECSVKQTFTFTISGGQVQVASADTLPLRVRQEASIGLLARSGTDVHLEARSQFRGAKKIEWAVTGGELVHQEGERARWRLPSEKGLYQVELVMDYGDDGLAFDALTLEVA